MSVVARSGRANVAHLDTSVFRKLAISYVYLFFVIQVIIQWLAMGVFFLVIVLISANLGIPPILYNSGAVAFVVLLVVQFVLSAQNRPQVCRPITS